MIDNNRPDFRNKTPTLLTLSAAAILLLLASPLLSLSYQPVQAQSSFSFRTTEPAFSEEPGKEQQTALTFDAQGTTSSSSNPQSGSITNGTFQLSSYPDGRILTSGNISHGQFSNISDQGSIIMTSIVDGGVLYNISTVCSTLAGNEITVSAGGQDTSFTFLGPVECSSSQSEGDTATTTQQSSSSSTTTATGTTTTTTTTTIQDRDRDGIPDANDNCPNLPDTRCYKEGDTALVVHNGNR